MTPPVLPVGGLLGGGEGPKISKLQALAAARKKKSEAVKKPEEPEERTQKRLAELNINEQTYSENVKPGSSILAKRQKLMSRHQAVRNLDYEEVLDEYDADDGELGADQLTPEDRDTLAKGAEQVCETLGSAAGSLTTQQIHDALWYYYYDIEKTVDYLLKKYITPPTPKSEPKKPKEACHYRRNP
ncbi:hypothetical protein BN1723_016370 [Verticillium longisporum]|uniref:HBS1-like protein N-terminal domain-containing protein n=1 Tax=Verticillium longisporum TaxID=100787 RepID=A0A0G4NE30_VERLO|nr:hypothetical protein BN1723_016370 [Verticillium longisporum]